MSLSQLWNLSRTLMPLLLVLAMTASARSQNGIPLPIDRDEQHTPAIEQALSTRLSVSFHDSQLQAVIAAWRAQFQINIVVDEKQLSEAGVTLDTPLSLELQNVRFESLLETILEPQDLDFVVCADHILVTTRDGAQAKPQIRMYPVQDLVLGLKGGRVVVDYDTLIQAITSTIDSDTWEENGGYGSLEPVSGSGALVVSQTRRVHRQVEAFLAAVREARDAQGIEVLPPNTQPAPDAPMGPLNSAASPGAAQPQGGFGGGGQGGGLFQVESNPK